MRRFANEHAAVALILLSVACGIPTEIRPLNPVEVIGRYELISIAGRTLPVVFPLTGPPRGWILADTIWFRPDSTYVEHMMREVIGPAPLFLGGRYSVEGGDISLVEVASLDQPSAGNEGPPVPGRIQDSTLVLGPSNWLFVRRCIGATC